LWSCGSKGPVSKTAARPTDNECLSVGRTQLSDTGVGDELTVVSQATRGITGQEQVDESCILEHDACSCVDTRNTKMSKSAAGYYHMANTAVEYIHVDFGPDLAQNTMT